MLETSFLYIKPHITINILSRFIHSCEIHPWWPQMKVAAWQSNCTPNRKIMKCTQIAKFMGPTWGPSGPCLPQMDPIVAPWTLVSGWLPFHATISEKLSQWKRPHKSVTYFVYNRTSSMERRRALDMDVFISCTYTGIILGKGWASRSNLVSQWLSLYPERDLPTVPRFVKINMLSQQNIWSMK